MKESLAKSAEQLTAAAAESARTQWAAEKEALRARIAALEAEVGATKKALAGTDEERLAKQKPQQQGEQAPAAAAGEVVQRMCWEPVGMKRSREMGEEGEAENWGRGGGARSGRTGHATERAWVR